MNISRLKRAFGSNYLALIAVTAAVSLLFYILNHDFLALDNIKNIMNAMSFTGTITVGMALLLIAGEVDLASGAEACFGGIVCAIAIQAGLPWPLALVAALAFGACCGFINAFFVNVVHIMGFICTLGILGIYNGLVSVVTDNHPVPAYVPSFWKLGSATVFGIFPLPFVIMVVLMVAYGLVLTRTNFGRNIFMIGGNRRAARLCGINPSRIVTALYVNNGMLAALAGVILTARMHNASPMAASTGAIDAITAAVLGGISFLGGVGGMGGCFIGILLITVFSAGLTAIGLPSYWQIVAQGAILVFALSADFFNSKARRKRLERDEIKRRREFARNKEES
ncbi:MAG: ABC transporter permease [Clostridiales Family XIII bacterium]|jgi:ribose/xylose/arabinose/galactoside ABC-type transport system permease subunit|nr:ABC transporter permease [Clostridiales Family XIII bacterium]